MGRDVSGDAHMTRPSVDFHLGEMSRKALSVHFFGKVRVGRGASDQIATVFYDLSKSDSLR